MAAHAAGGPRRAGEYVRRHGALLAWLWGAWLFTSILVAGLKLYPSVAGRVTLALIAGGFLLFGVARASLGHLAEAPSSCAALLSPRMKVVYWAGYALMFAGTALTTFASVVPFGD